MANLKILRWGLAAVMLLGLGCSSSSGSGNGAGGSAAKGGSTSTNGGSSVTSGGSAPKGGSSNGGSASGGVATNGGSSNGGSTSGGSSNGGAPAAGGSSNGGSSTAGATAAGGSTPSSVAELNCPETNYPAVKIPGIQVISDFETDSLQQYVQDGRGDKAEPWYAYADGDTNDANGEMTTPGPKNPKASGNNFKVDSTVHGPCSTKGALHISTTGSDKYVGFGIDFMARTAARKKLTYDASKYTGIGFFAKCAKDLQFAYFKAPDAKQDADVEGATCKYSDNTCNQFGIKNAVITKDWQYYKLYFSELLQDPNGKNFITTGVDKTKLTAFQIHVNPFSPRSGTATANPFDCYIDDVHFLTEAAPVTPTADVSWSTEGNVIKRNGAAYKIRGLVRPSMEWDCAGFGVTHEDIKRMKSWKANAIRLAVSDKLWKGASTGSATCDGGAYQRNVKRVINWIIQEGMDVILDLHYVSGTPSAENATFWSDVTKDSFFKDGRILFELWNEPTADIGTLRTWHNGVISSIRGNGATKNLILVSGVDYTYDISGYVSAPVTDTAKAVAYVTHPYIFKPTNPGDEVTYLTPSKTLPVIATEFGDARVDGVSNTPPDKCEANIYSNYISKFETAGMSWTSWAWIVDEWGCGFPQLLADYSGTPNAIGKPVHDQLTTLNK